MSTKTNRVPTVILGVSLAVIFALVGVTFLGLAIALPISLTVIDQFGLYVSTTDLATATQLSAFVPVFIVVAIGFFVASLATIVKLIQRVDPAPAA